MAQETKPHNSFCGQTSRREMLRNIGGGFPAMALTGMLANDGFFTPKVDAASGLDKLQGPLAPKWVISTARPRMSYSSSCTVGLATWTLLTTSLTFTRSMGKLLT